MVQVLSQHQIPIGEVVLAPFAEQIGAETFHEIAKLASFTAGNEMVDGMSGFVHMAPRQHRSVTYVGPKGNPRMLKIPGFDDEFPYVLAVKGTSQGGAERDFNAFNPLDPSSVANCYHREPNGTFTPFGVMLDGSRDRILAASEMFLKLGIPAERVPCFVYPEHEILKGQVVSPQEFIDFHTAAIQSFGGEIAPGLPVRMPRFLHKEHRLIELLEGNYDLVAGSVRGSLGFMDVSDDKTALIGTLEAFVLFNSLIGILHNDQKGAMMAHGFPHLENATSVGSLVDFDSVVCVDFNLGDTKADVLRYAMRDVHHIAGQLFHLPTRDGEMFTFNGLENYFVNSGPVGITTTLAADAIRSVIVKKPDSRAKVATRLAGLSQDELIEAARHVYGFYAGVDSGNGDVVFVPRVGDSTRFTATEFERLVDFNSAAAFYDSFSPGVLKAVAEYLGSPEDTSVQSLVEKSWLPYAEPMLLTMMSLAGVEDGKLAKPKVFIS